MSWWKRIKTGIRTPTREKKETKEGLWYNCPKCKEVISSQEHADNKWVCKSCNNHERISSLDYFAILFDDNKFKELFSELVSVDPLNFEDTKKYIDRIKSSQEKTGLNDAIRSAHGKVNGTKIVICAMDFSFIGGSMGSVVGEKIAKSIDYSLKNKIPLLIISKSGGARMMEGAFSLMQMAKTAAKLSLLSKAKVPYISLMTDPTTGGVTASFASLGDFNIAEPGALIGFAGPRIIKETIGKNLPKGFQTSEFVLEHGFLDFIVDRDELKKKISLLIKFIEN